MIRSLLTLVVCWITQASLVDSSPLREPRQIDFSAGQEDSICSGNENIGIDTGRSSFRSISSYIALSAAGAAIFVFDRELNRLTQNPRLHSRFADHHLSNIERLGRDMPFAIAVPVLMGHGLAFKNRRSTSTGGELLAGAIFSTGITRLVKRTFGRKRPYETDSPNRFFDGGTAFYSGHTVSIFTFATIVSKNYPRQNLSFVGLDRDLPLLPVLTYSLGGLVGFQRLYHNHHWASDVFFGACAGYALGSLVVHLGNKIQGEPSMMVPGSTTALTLRFYFE